MSNYKHLIQENAWLRQKLAELKIPTLMNYLDKSHYKTIRLARQQEDWNIKNAKGVIPSKDYIHKLNKLETGKKRAVVSIANQFATQSTEDAMNAYIADNPGGQQWEWGKKDKKKNA